MKNPAHKIPVILFGFLKEFEEQSEEDQKQIRNIFVPMISIRRYIEISDVIFLLFCHRCSYKK